MKKDFKQRFFQKNMASDWLSKKLESIRSLIVFLLKKNLCLELFPTILLPQSTECANKEYSSSVWLRTFFLLVTKSIVL